MEFYGGAISRRVIERCLGRRSDTRRILVEPEHSGGSEFWLPSQDPIPSAGGRLPGFFFFAYMAAVARDHEPNALRCPASFWPPFPAHGYCRLRPRQHGVSKSRACAARSGRRKLKETPSTPALLHGGWGPGWVHRARDGRDLSPWRWTRDGPPRPAIKACHGRSAVRHPSQLRVAPSLRAGPRLRTFGSPGTAAFYTRRASRLERRDLSATTTGRGSSRPFRDLLIITSTAAPSVPGRAKKKERQGQDRWRTSADDSRPSGPRRKPESEGDYRKRSRPPHVAPIGGRPVLTARLQVHLC